MNDQRVRPAVLLVCFLIIVLDGLDTLSISFVAPALARLWNIPPAAMTPAFVATSMGAVIGYLLSGPLAARFGQRRVGSACVLLFGLATLLSAWAPGIVSLAALRLIAAIGLGGVLPVAVSTAVGASPARLKETIATLVALGLSAGSVVAGVIGVPLMKLYGWQSVFIVGGILPLVLLPFFRAVIPATASPQAQPGQRGSVALLFADGLAPRTLLLWLFAFLIFLDSYALIFWIPTLLGSFGFSPAQVPLATAATGLGGLIGGVLMLLLVGSLGAKRVLGLMVLVATACVLLISKMDIPPGLVLPVIAGMGGALITCCVGQSALAVSFYPPEARTTGVGMSAAAGRIGSIVGPAVGGLLLSLGSAPRDIVLTTVIPALIALAVLVAMGLLERSRAKQR